MKKLSYSQKRLLRRKSADTLYFMLLLALAVVMVYPFFWLFFAAFKTNTQIFSQGAPLLPDNLNFAESGFVTGWQTAKYTYTTYYINTFKLVIPIVVGTVLSSTLAGYGFARFNFPGKKILFSLMIATLLLPNAVTLIPKYLMFAKFGWLDSYKPFIIPAFFATNAFLVYLLVQFFRGIPKELDEAAMIDGCGSFRLLWKIMVPLCKPAIVTVALNQFIWAWNNFMGPLIYINSNQKYPVALALRLTAGNVSTMWNKVFAMSFLAILPLLIVYFSAQKYFVEGIATTGIKG